MSGVNYAARIAAPARHSINSKLSPCHQATMLKLFGKPGLLSRECSDITNARLKKLIVTENVGPFRVWGASPAVDDLKLIFAAVKAKEPALYTSIQTEGMLCCRAVRGSATSYSNHSWGFAIDLRVGDLVQYGETNITQGLLSLYPYFHASRWYWGLGFPKADAMHFEPSDELVHEWAVKGLFGKG